MAAAVPAMGAAVSAPMADAEPRWTSLLRSEEDAWRALAPLWNLALGDEGNPCETAQRSHIHCFRGSSNLAEIRQLGRPGILTLRDPAGQDGYALLTGLTGQGATLRMGGGQTQTVPFATLARMWRGDFATYWRTPPGYRADQADRRTGPLVDWLAAQVARLDGTPPPAGAQILNASLKARINEFQVSQGLSPDGVPGPKTLMQLNRATGVEEPRLQTEK
jgi:general secretion pathway protein A